MNYFQRNSHTRQTTQCIFQDAGPNHP